MTLQTTKNVYLAAKHILETYDGIPTTDIDYGNLAGQRSDWIVGRQVNKQDSSAKYLKELMKNSFCCIYPTRDGKRGLKAWRSDEESVATHDEDAISKMISFKDSPNNRIYNDLVVNYDWDEGMKKYKRSVFVTNTGPSQTFPTLFQSTDSDNDNSYAVPAACSSVILNSSTGQAVFVADPTGFSEVGQAVCFDDGSGNIVSFGLITSISSSSKTVYFDYTNTYSATTGTYTTGTFYVNATNVPKWTIYVGGYTDYTTSKSWWEICQNSYEKNLSVNKLEIDCPWFINNADFDEGPQNAAIKLMGNLVEWCPRQKQIATYTLPITGTNLGLDMLDPITFNHAKYTNSVDRLGWISKIKHVLQKKEIEIELTLIPIDLEELDLIIETGSAPDTITESGSQPDTITEGAQ